MTRNNLGILKWESGCINDNIIKVLRKQDLNYRRTFNGDIEVNITGKWVQVKYILINKDEELYQIYIN